MPSSRNANPISASSRGVPDVAGSGSNLALWIAAARPKTLVLAVAPVVAGIGLAVFQTGELAAVTALLTLIAAVAIQIGTNLHNDASDYERGTDTADRLGPPRATAEGWFSLEQVKRAAHLAFGLAFVIGLALVVRGGWPILAIGIASLVAGYAYTGGPRPIAYGPFGELYVLLFFGLAAVGGTYYLQTLAFDWPALMVGIALGLPAAAVLLLNNYRDLETDRIAGRRTLCHHLGRPRARVLYGLLLLGSIAILGLTFGPTIAWPLLAAVPLGTLLTLKLVRGATGRQINPLLGQTGLFQAAVTVLLLVGFGLSRIA
ncbi:1,4-dihydroxy-2-naphthoate prenyltransferase [Thiocapsa roseopersicina]|uniref:1,4-dihydroxy-2-naphthoate octaprenyltransferase n=1 Tax=Thiocapsa roseopersicina TaxID=1058 RepID=A0A1H2WXX1_THIRO|nr:1,4-dihydroxy-2-naphthoate prenyltransferase [Thiocapsa roseopersicina]